MRRPPPEGVEELRAAVRFLKRGRFVAHFRGESVAMIGVRAPAALAQRACPEFPNGAARGIIVAMARIVFSLQLRRFTKVPEKNVPADPLRAALDDPFRPDSEVHVLQALSRG